jgi:hypothetical protein
MPLENPPKVDYSHIPTNMWARKGSKDQKFHVDVAKLAACLTASGFSQKNVEKMLGVKAGAIKRWKERFPEFALAMSKGKEAAIRYLKASAIQLASGYDYTETTINLVPDAETGEDVVKSKQVKVRHHPPNTTMLIFLLCNLTRDTDEPLRNVQSVEVENNTKTEDSGKDSSSMLLDALTSRLEARQLAKKAVDGEVVDASE